MINRKKMLIISILIIVLVVIISSIIFNNKLVKEYDIEKSKNLILEKYPELNLRELDYIDVSMYFGIDLNEIPSSLFLTDFYESEENTVFNPNNLIIIINSKNIDNYYNTFRGYLDINKDNLENTEDIKKFENAILKKKKNKLYLVLGNKQEEIEKIIKDND